MIQVRVRYFNLLATYAGTKSQVVDLDVGVTAAELFSRLAQEHSPAFAEMLLSKGKISPHLRVFRNDAILEVKELNLPLSDGDELLIFPAISGGSQITDLRILYERQECPACPAQSSSPNG
ncbi:MAG: MoaD/ThiS family protein [Anaerolineaceae bacterium]|nr:MoaD/ThiS family protein [Anaerolineaceae bacterium]